MAHIRNSRAGLVVRATDAQDAAVTAEAHRLGVSKAEVIRRAIDEAFGLPKGRDAVAVQPIDHKMRDVRAQIRRC